LQTLSGEDALDVPDFQLSEGVQLDEHEFERNREASKAARMAAQGGHRESIEQLRQESNQRIQQLQQSQQQQVQQLQQSQQLQAQQIETILDRMRTSS